MSDNKVNSTTNRERSLDTKSLPKDVDRKIQRSITEISELLIKYFNTELNIRVTDQGTERQVPTFFGMFSRFVSTDKMPTRDEKGQTQYPYILLKRGNISESDMKTFQQESTYVVTTNTRKHKFSIIDSMLKGTHTSPKRTVVIRVPKRMVLTYEGVIRTTKQSHMDDIINQLNYIVPEYMGDKYGIKVHASITNFGNDVRFQKGESRIISSTMELEVEANLLPKYLKDKRTSSSIWSASKVNIGVEESFTL